MAASTSSAGVTSSSAETRSVTSEILDTATASETEEGSGTSGSVSRSLSPCKVPAADKAEGDNWWIIISSRSLSYSFISIGMILV